MNKELFQFFLKILKIVLAGDKNVQ